MTSQDIEPLYKVSRTPATAVSHHPSNSAQAHGAYFVSPQVHENDHFESSSYPAKSISFKSLG